MVEDKQKWEKRKQALLENIEEVIVNGKEEVNTDIYLIMRELLLSSKTRTSISEFYKKEEK